MKQSFLNCVTSKKFVIENNLKENVFLAFEQNTWLKINCGGANRDFEMKILNDSNDEILHLSRPLTFKCCMLSSSILQKIDVYEPVGSIIGSIEEEWAFINPKLNIKNAYGDTILYIQVPICTYAITKDVDFKVTLKFYEKKIY